MSSNYPSDIFFQKKKDPGFVTRRPSKALPLIQAALGILAFMFVFAVICDYGYIFPKSKKGKNVKAQFKKFIIPEYLWTADERVTGVM